ncbi:MAG: branched-chain amino acid ABC transporter permease [Armatimonadota bacterium]|nr:branched-chain amino acid ABC transporter permease [Armatimonadota bacterium]MDR7438743.1 branched-chain amino acid ABC transporter permease [Armatimonadota bacterium]MDR7561959.1 branched-chain amino acid ABC transporter permease [Armatimonadota bacterium]MDR7566906.1 branched-chain amino acid ABC transporter permease [Armatimonadota bacterium]
MVELAQATVSGVLMGTFYALLALGLTLAWGFFETIDFTHFAIIFGFGYVAYELATRGVDLRLVLLLVAPAGALAGVLWRLVLRRLRLDAARSLVFTFGALVVFEGLSKLVWTADYRRIPTAQNPYAMGAVALGPLALPFTQVVSFALSLVVAGAVGLWLRQSYAGKALRAAVSDEEMARSCGADVERLRLLIAALGGATGGIGGVLVAMNYALFPNAAEQWIGLLFAAVILGGIGNPAGLVLGGTVIGIAEALAQGLGATAVARLVGAAALVIGLLVRPEGLFPSVLGRREG